MRTYVMSDIHGFYTPMRRALTDAGWFADTGPHRLVILGDLFDRGKEALKLQKFILQLLRDDACILVRGNHEDLYQELVLEDKGFPYDHHLSNGTYDTALQLTGFDRLTALSQRERFTEAAKETPFYTEILPAMRDFCETERYVFVHGWIPTGPKWLNWPPVADWRNASGEAWREARWTNGMEAARRMTEEKTVVCGHWHASYGHARLEGNGSEFGTDADFTPYYGRNIIAVDACTALSGIVNCIVLET